MEGDCCFCRTGDSVQSVRADWTATDAPADLGPSMEGALTKNEKENQSIRGVAACGTAVSGMEITHWMQHLERNWTTRTENVLRARN